MADPAPDPLLARLLPGFVAEAEDLVGRATVALLALERGPDPAAADAVLRALHTLKGGAATLALDPAAGLAHALEDALTPAVGAGLAHAHVDAALGALDAFMAHVRAAAAGEPPPPLDEALRRCAALAGGAAEAAPAREGAVGAEAEGAAAAAGGPEAPASGEADAWRVRAEDVAALGREVERLRELRLRLEARRGALEAAAAAATGAASAALAAAARGLAADEEEAGVLVGDLEGAVRAISTLPARVVTEPLHRAVRDLCRATGKRARLSIVGGEVALERRLLGALGGALVHLVRNAVDHGIEPPAAREVAGKDQEGLITVRLEQHGNAVHVEVTDDGGGIDVARVRAAALARGVVDAAALAALSDDEARRLIFAPRLSTRAEADGTSGRGVGLDAVRAAALALRGQVGVESRPGQGSTFQLTLPVELGGTPLLVVRAGEHRVGLPLAVVEAARRLGQGELGPELARPTLVLGDEAVPVRDLAAALGLRRPLPPRPGCPLVLVRGAAGHTALAVDEIAGQEDLVVRPLPEELGPSPAWLGVATLAHGELLLVVRPAWLQGADAAAAPAASGPLALVVDDALTARALHRASLEAGGFQVHLASSAEQALALSDLGRYEVLVTDLRLGGADGLELARRVRAAAETRDLPVVVVSAQDDDGTRRAALEAGADAFVAKRDCARGALAAEVRAAIARRRALA